MDGDRTASYHGDERTPRVPISRAPASAVHSTLPQRKTRYTPALSGEQSQYPLAAQQQRQAHPPTPRKTIFLLEKILDVSNVQLYYESKYHIRPTTASLAVQAQRSAGARICRLRSVAAGSGDGIPIFGLHIAPSMCCCSMIASRRFLIFPRGAPCLADRSSQAHCQCTRRGSKPGNLTTGVPVERLRRANKRGPLGAAQHQADMHVRRA